jgi:uncharacterized membrane protein
MDQIIVGLLYVSLPGLILYLCHRYRFLNKVGAVVIAYVFGLILGVSGLSNEQFHTLQEIMMSATVPLAIPLLLFSSNVREWKKLAVQPFYSLLFALIAVIISVVVGFYLFDGGEQSDFHKVGGMLIGIYSGGTPNLASLKMMLDVDEGIYLAIHSYDMMIGAVYLFFLMGFGQKVFQWVLPRFKFNDQVEVEDYESENLSHVLKQKDTRIKLLKLFALTFGMVAVAGGIMLLLPESIQMVSFIFLITAFGIGGSSVKWMNETIGSFDLGMYLILIFSVVVASQIQPDTLTDIDPSIFAYITFVVFVSLLLHVLLSRFRKIDTDTVIVTSTALLCSPPFVPVVAGALRNRSVIVPGLTIGLIGYAIGNYLGYLMALLLSYM